MFIAYRIAFEVAKGVDNTGIDSEQMKYVENPNAIPEVKCLPGSRIPKVSVELINETLCGVIQLLHINIKDRGSNQILYSCKNRMIFPRVVPNPEYH